MAKMYPEPLPRDVLDNPYRGAEIEVYNRLREQLPDDYICYYSRPWLGLHTNGEEKDGEADFVVAHPVMGFLTIEVKGGTVRREEVTERWTSTNRLGITNKIKDPAKQAHDSKYELLKKLKQQPDWRRGFVTARYGVILTDSAKPEADLGPGMPLKIFLFGEELKYIREWVDSRLAAAGDGSDRPGLGLGVDGMRALHQMLAGRIELRPSLARGLRNDHRQIERLTSDQIDILDMFEESKRMAIAGGAGTGKTILAMEKAARLAEGGSRTLLACYNAPLGHHIQRLAADIPSLQAGSFHAICDRIRRVAGITITGEGEHFYAQLPAALEAAMLARPDLRFDAVIVDEGQDFQDEWFELLEKCLIDPPSGSFYVFYDDNQRLYDRRGRAMARIPTSPVHLIRNFRNTRTIHNAAKNWYAGKMTRAIGPEGTPVHWVPSDEGKGMAAAVEEVIEDLVTKHGLAPDDIAVLTPKLVRGHNILRDGRIAGFDVTDATIQESGRLIFDTVRRFKGLERSAILLVDADEIRDAEIAYVGISRASVYLAIIGPSRDLVRIRDKGD
jgi:hypothetical protein